MRFHDCKLRGLLCWEAAANHGRPLAGQAEGGMSKGLGLGF